MPIRVDLLPLAPPTPGQARLSVKKWQGADSTLEFSIQRNQDGYFLQQDKQWSEAAFWFRVTQLTSGSAGETLETPVGADVVDPLLEGSHNSNFRLELREQGHGYVDFGVIRPAAGLLPSSAGGATRSSYETGTLAVSAPEIPAIPEQELPDSTRQELPAEPTALPAPTSNARWILPLAASLLVVLALSVGGWFWLHQKSDAPQVTTQLLAQAPAQAPTQVPMQAPAPTPALTQAPTPAGTQVLQAADGSCTLERMASQSELSFVQDCIKQAPASAALLKIIATAKANQHCGIAQRLYANRAQSGDIEIALAYAHEYDPAVHTPSECFKEPDATTAAYWYETVLSYVPGHPEAKQRLQELQP